MKKGYSLLALFTFLFFAFAPRVAWGQWTTPTVNAANGGVSEYPNTSVSGATTWGVSWNDTDFFVVATGANEAEDMSIFLDVDPIAPVNGGTDANGNLQGITNNGYTTAPTLPMRADILIYVRNNSREIFRRNGSGGWTSLGGTPNGLTGTANDYVSATAGHYSSNDNGNGAGSDDRREFRVSWSRLLGTINGGLRPSSFNWLGYISYNNGMYAQLPTQNYNGNNVTGNTGNASYTGLVRYFTILNTGNGTSTNPFLNNSFTNPPAGTNGSFGAISVYDYTMNSASQTVTRQAGGGGAWSVTGNLVVANGTITGGTSTTAITANNVDIRGGTLTLSGSVGGDMNVTGNFIKTSGTLNANARQIAFTGTTKQRWNSSVTESQNLFLANSNTTDSVRIETPITLSTAGNTINFAANTRTALVGGATLTSNTGAITTAGAFQILPGATFVSGSTGTHTFTGGVMTVNGTFRRTASSTLTGASATTLVIGNGGTYDHAHPAGTVPTANWSTGSTALISGITGTQPAGMTQNFHHVTWNSAGQNTTINLSLAAGTYTWGGNFRIINTGTPTSNNGLRISNNAVTLNIGGNFEVSSTGGASSRFDFNNGGTGITLNITGNLIHSLAGAGDATIANVGNAGTNALRFVASTGTQTITQTGAVTVGTQNTINWAVANTGTGVTQLASNIAKGSGTGTFNVTSGTLDFQNFQLSGGGAFTSSATSTLRTANTTGTGAFASTGATGSVQTTGTRTYTAGTSYTFNSSTAQFTGSGVSSTTAGTITLAGTGGVTLTAATLAANVAFTANALLTLGANNLTVNTGITGATALRHIRTNSTGQLRRTVTSSAVSFPVGNATYNPITLTNTGTSDTYGIRVVDAAHPNANDNTVVVNRYWDVTEAVAGGSTLVPVVAQYNGSDPRGAGFDAGTTNYVGLYQTGWTQQTATLGGSDPFTFTTAASLLPSTASYSLAIGRDGAFIPLPINYTWDGSAGDGLWGTAANWTPSGIPIASDNVTLVTAGTNLNLATAQTVLDLTINGNFAFAATGALTVTGNVTYTSGAPTFHEASTFTLSSAAAQNVPPLNYGNLNVSGGARTFANTTTGIAGTFTPSSSNTFGTGTIDFIGTGAQTINALNYFNLSNSGNGDRTLAAGIIGIGGVYSPTTGTITLGTGTIDFTSAGSQTIPATFYNNLTNTGGGARTLVGGSGTIYINTAYTPTVGAITVSTSTVDFQNAASQTIPATSFFNLNNSGNGPRTLASGTINVAGTYTPTSNVSITVTGNTFNFSSASSQDFPATQYNNVTNTGNGTRVWANSGNIDIFGAFTPSTGTNNITGSTVRYRATSGTTTIPTIPSTDIVGKQYENLVINGSGGTFQLASGATISTNSGFTMSTGTFHISNGAVAATLNVGTDFSLSTGTVNVNFGTSAGTLNITGNYSQVSGTLNVSNPNTGGPAAGMTVGGTFTMSGGAMTLTSSIVAASTTTVTVTGAVTVSGSSNIVLEGGATGPGTAIFIAQSDATFAGSSTLNFGSSATGTLTNNEFRVSGSLIRSGTGAFTSTGTSNLARGVVFAGTSQQFTYSSSTNPTRTPFVVNSGTTVEMLSGVVMNVATLNPSFTVNGTLDVNTRVISGTGTFALASGATLRSSISSGVAGNITTTTRTFDPAANYTFNSGAVNQFTGFGTAGITTANNLTINNTSAGQSVLLDGALTINGDLNFTSGLFLLGANNVTLGSSATLTGATSTRYVVTNSTGGLIWNSIATAATRTFPIGLATVYVPISITNQDAATSFTARVVDGISGTVADATKVVTLHWPITSASTNADVTFNWPAAEHAGSFDLPPSGTAEIGRSTGGLYTVIPANTGLTIGGSDPYTATATGLTSFGAGGFYAVGNTSALDVPFTTYTWNGATDSDWATATNWTPNGIPGTVDNVILNVPGTNPLIITSNRSVSDFTLNGTGTFTLNAGVNLTLSGAITYGGTPTATLSSTSTVAITSVASQSVPPLNYGNLNLTGGDRVFVSGATTGIAGTLTPGAGLLTFTGSTIDFNGTGAQTINALSYDDLTVSGNRGGGAITLASGTIAVGSTFVASLTNYTAATTGNTFNITSAGAEPVPAFFYNNLNVTGGNRTWASTGVIDIAGTFTPGAGTHTITGSTVRFAPTSGTVAIPVVTTTVPTRSYNNLEVAPAVGATSVMGNGFVSIGITGNLTFTGAGEYHIVGTATSSANIVVVDGTYNQTGTGTVTVGRGTLAATLTVAGAADISNGQLVVANTATAGLTIRFNALAGLTISGTGRLNLEASSNTSYGLVSTTNLTVTSSSATAIDLGSGTANGSSAVNGNIITLSGNFNKSGSGAIAFSGTYSTFSGYLFNHSGTQTWDYTGAAMTGGNFTVNATSTLVLNTGVSLPATGASIFLVVGRLNMGSNTIVAGNATSSFNSSAGIIQTALAGGISAAISGFNNAATNWTSPTQFEYTGNNVNTGLFGYSNISSSVSHVITWLGTGNLTLDKPMQLSTLNFTNSGFIILGANSITIPSSGTITGSGFGATKMIVADGAGTLIRSITAAGVGIPFTWPIGDNTSGAEYSPVTINNISTSIAGTIGFRVTDAPHPSNAPAATFLSRYWTYTFTGLGSYNWTNSTFTYDASDIVGTETSLKGNIWNAAASGWNELATSSAASNVLTIASGTTSSSLATGDDITGRVNVPIYYRTVAIGPATWSTPATWEISSDPAFVSPAPVAASVAPNATNSGGITILAGHTVNNTSNISVDQLTINATGVLNANAQVNIANGTGTDLTVNGTLNNNASSTWATATTISVPAGGLILSTASISSLGTVTIAGTYEHNINGGTIPTATWSTGSLCTVTGSTSNTSGPGGIGQNFYDLTWNSTGQFANVNLNGVMNGVTIANDFNVLSTGGSDLRITGSLATALTVTRDVNVAPTGFLVLTQTGSSFTPNATCSLTIGRDLLISGGGVTVAGNNSTGANTPTIAVGRDLTISGTSGQPLVIAGGGSAATVTVARNFTHGGTQNVRISNGAGNGILTVTGRVEISGGLLPMTTAAGSGTLNVSGDLVFSSGTISQATGTATINFRAASGTQQWTSSGTITGNVNINVGTGTSTNTVALQANANLGTGTGVVTVLNGATLDMADRVISGSSVFTQNATGILRIGHPQGISASGATGNIQTTGTRTFVGTGGFSYTGTVDQVTGNGLPATLTTGNLTIANTGTTNKTVTLTTAGTTLSTLNLTSGVFAIGTGVTLNVASGGTVNTITGATLATGTAGGTLNFAGTGVFNGADCGPYNVFTSGGVNFGTLTTIQNGGTFRINTGGFANTNAPAYAVGSTLQYNTGGTFGRNLEWRSGSGKGYPHHVTLTNNTTLNPGDNSNTGVVFNMGGDLLINTGSAVFMDFGANDMTVPLNVVGNVTIDGSLSLSDAIGGDINLQGNWVLNGIGNNFGNKGRQVAFTGTGAQTIGGTNLNSGNPFAFLAITNTSTAPTGVTLNASILVSNRLQMNSGLLYIGNNNINMSTGGFVQCDPPSQNTKFIVTNGTGVLTQQVDNTGNKFFPVGPSFDRFASVTLRQTNTTVKDISVRTISTITNPLITATAAVNVEYILSETGSGTNSLTTTFGWGASAEGTTFVRTGGVYQGKWNGSTYDFRPTQTTSGSDPYFSLNTVPFPYTGTLVVTQPFVVGNYVAFRACANSTAGGGEWSTPSTWTDVIEPPANAAVCLFGPVTITTAQPTSVALLDLNPSSSLTISNAYSLQIDAGGAMTNATGAPVVFGTGTVEFLGLATIGGANPITYNRLKLNGNTNFATNPTVNDTLTFRAGSFVLTGGINYGPSSTLKYYTGGSYGRNTEWSATSGTGFPANVLVAGGTTLNVNNFSNTARAISGSITVDNGSSLTMGSMTGNLTVPGNFTLNGAYTQSTASGGDLVLGGNWNSSTTATLTSNNRDVRFNGTAGQTISNTASGLQFGFLTIDNTGSGVDLLNTITVNNTFRVNTGRTFTLTTDKIIIAGGGTVLINGTFDANSGTIEFANGGTFTNNGTFNRGTSTVDFTGAGTGSVNGSATTNFHNIRLFPGGGINFFTGPFRGQVSGTFQLRPGSFVTGSAPIYEVGSKLQYAGGGTFNRNIEWDNTTLQKVEVTNSTILRAAGLANVNAGFPATMADSLIVQSGSTFEMNSMTADLTVGTSVEIRGTLALSTNAGSDMFVAGDWVNNAGTFTSNDRLVTFNGTTNGSIKGSSNTTFPFVTVDKGINAALTAQVPFTLSRTGGTTLRVSGGILNLNGQAMTLGGGSNTLRIDSNYVKGQTLRTGGTSIAGFNAYRRGNLTADSLGGKVEYSGGGTTTALTVGYNLLAVTGNTTVQVNANTRVADSLIVTAGSTIDFSSTAKILSRGNVLNQGIITGTNAGELVLTGTATQAMAGSGTYGRVVINNVNNVTSANMPTISNSLVVQLGKLTSGSNPGDTIVLGPTANLTETIGGGEHFVRGALKTTRVVGTAGETFGGLGFGITPGADLGTIRAVRVSGQTVSGQGVCCSGNNSISRFWIIKPSIQPATPNRNVLVQWPSQDDDGQNMTLLQLWKSSNGIAAYDKMGAVQDVSATNPRSAWIYNIASFSWITGSDNANPLPLGLLRFAGANQKGDALLNWSITNEKSWSLFVVERSADGKAFGPIGTVRSLANGRALNAYTYVDKQLGRAAYYRLKLVDADNVSEYSDVVYISTDGTATRTLSIYPNPAANGAQIAIDGITELGEAVTVDIIALDGRKVETLQGQLGDINQALQDRVASLPTGLYQVKVTLADQIKTLKLMKQ